MKVPLEYGLDMLEANLPDDTDVFVPGETVPDPPFIEDVAAATRQSLRNPIGSKPLSILAKPGNKVTIVFPDRVKGGEQPTAHRKVAIPLVIDELVRAGVSRKDILLICSNGLHRKNSAQEIAGLLGEPLFSEFWAGGQIINHDSEDEEHLVDLGTTPQGDPVLMNRYVFESDVAVLIGHTLGNPYGGYSGGYKHCSTGLTHWRSIASHHVPGVMHAPDFVPVSGHSVMRHKMDEIGMHMEERMGKRFFCCDAVLDTRARQIEINSGYAAEMQPQSWITADKRTYVPWAEHKYDVLVFGAPRGFHYGDGMGTNPVMLMQAISAQVIRHKRVLSDRCVFIVASVCDGYFNDVDWPYMREIYALLQAECNTLPEMNNYGERFATNPEYIRQYREGTAYHPFHPFSMMACGHLAEKHTAAVYIVGAKEPGIARGMGLKTRATVEEALEDAKIKYVGAYPRVLALPRTFRTAAVHLCLKNEPIVP
ncbi:MAG: lactate racemase domain-containing protein [Anaerolineae bacterium]